MLQIWPLVATDNTNTDTNTNTYTDTDTDTDTDDAYTYVYKMKRTSKMKTTLKIEITIKMKTTAKMKMTSKMKTTSLGASLFWFCCDTLNCQEAEEKKNTPIAEKSAKIMNFYNPSLREHALHILRNQLLSISGPHLGNQDNHGPDPKLKMIT